MKKNKCCLETKKTLIVVHATFLKLKDLHRGVWPGRVWLVGWSLTRSLARSLARGSEVRMGCLGCLGWEMGGKCLGETGDWTGGSVSRDASGTASARSGAVAMSDMETRGSFSLLSRWLKLRLPRFKKPNPVDFLGDPFSAARSAVSALLASMALLNSSASRRCISRLYISCSFWRFLSFFSFSFSIARRSFRSW